MPSATSFGIFLTAAIVLAVSPGPGMLYVLARSKYPSPRRRASRRA